MAIKYFDGKVKGTGKLNPNLLKYTAGLNAEDAEVALNEFRFANYLQEVWKLIRNANKFIEQKEPWALAKDETKKEALEEVIYSLLEAIRIIAVLIAPALPATSEKIAEQLGVTISGWDVLWKDTQEYDVKRGELLFPRLDIEKEVEELQELFSEKKEETEAPLEHKAEISIDDLDKIELRIGKIINCEKHPKADRLLVSQVKIGPETRQIVSGIAKWYKPEDLIGKEVTVVCNLKPVKLRGELSQGMILAGEKDGILKLASVDPKLENGAKVK